MNINDCEGCNTKRFASVKHSCTPCSILYKDISKVIERLPMCPCSICIIKVMCVEQCEEHRQYTEKSSIIMKKFGP